MAPWRLCCGLSLLIQRLKERQERDFLPRAKTFTYRTGTVISKRFKLPIRKKFLITSTVRHWNRLFREVVGASFLEVF